ncbi:DNA-binding transcription factor yap1 [Linnemannia hyalina]|uniref:DNA-binding transcription factor yap1 n=1 Tax=Linnemannia hyalina TaxID=64524 RepID=A0A9P7XRN6_9FUNG|nr:DNA-binding transcription factor yap1 [Linnemannia hyalina]
MATYSNHNGYSDDDDDDEDLHFQDDDYNDNDDVDMAYTVHDTPSSSSYNNNPFGGVASASAPNGPFNNDNNNTDNTNNSNNNSTQNGKGAKHKASFSEPKEKKKPGRKPVQTCPALRKEQNRAAQRAFRDRKERHLHQLENMIKDLKNQHYLVTSRLQSEAHDLKTVIESLQSENFYLREVVFAFESALSKGNHIDILKTVKQELFRRHHQSRRSSSTPSVTTPSTPGTDHLTPPNMRSSLSPSVSSTLPTSPGTPVVSATAASSTGAASASPASLDTRPRTSSPLSPSMANRQTTPPKPTFSSSSPHHTPSPLGQSHNNNHYQGDMDVSDQARPMREHPINDDISEEGILSMSGNILYKAPPLFIPDMLEKGGQLGMPVSPFGSISVPRPAYCPPGTTLPEKTEYTKHANVFEELQSSLFPPGTLESLHISMATPQEVVSEETPFAETIQIEADRASMQMDRDRDNHWDNKDRYNNIQYDNNNRNRASSSSSSDLPMHIKVEPESDEETLGLDAEQLRNMAASLGLKMGTTKRHRLHRELQILIAAEPQTDPNIDPKVYELPHDPRIDFVPCPKLRAQMIVHQQRYNADELFQLLIDEAVCHGPPLHKDSWQLPEAFFDRFGFLLGLEFDRIRHKMWPVKYPK